MPTSNNSRRLVVGCYPVHVGVRSSAIPGGERLRNPNDDNGLQIHGAPTRLQGVQRVRTA